MQIAIDKIKPYSKNAKQHPKKQIEQIAASIKAFGFNQPIVIDKGNVIIVGHGRYEAAKKLELKQVPVLQVDLPKDEANAYRLADNKLNESDWEMDLVIEELKTLGDDLVALTGFDSDLILEDEEEDDVVPETPDKPKTKLLDIYQLGNHKLMCGDSTNFEHVEKLMNGQQADLVFTDPPYNLAYDFAKNGMVQTGKRKARFKQIKNDEMSPEKFNKFIYDCFVNMHSFLKDGGTYYISGGRESTQIFNNKLAEAGFHISQWIVWKKENFNISRLSYHPSHEIITMGWKKGEKHQWYGGRNQRDVLEFSRETGKSVHPTQKPVALLEKLFVNSSKAGDLIMDLFLGSGASLITAEKTNRSCYGMELDPKYCDVIIKRWEDYSNKKAKKLN